MKFTTAAVILALANAAHVHGRCEVNPDPATGVVVVPTEWTEIGVEVSPCLFLIQRHSKFAQFEIRTGHFPFSKLQNFSHRSDSLNRTSFSFSLGVL